MIIFITGTVNMKLIMKFELDDEERKNINKFLGRKGLATRKTIKALIDGAIQDMLFNMYSEVEEDKKRIP